jgi:hypothetical protein
MRLSEDRINAIAYKIAFELVKKRHVRTDRNLRQMTTWVEKPILDHLSIESRLEEEVRATLARMTTCPPVGSIGYDTLFQKKKEELANKYNYEL